MTDTNPAQHCPDCGLKWRHFGPFELLECDNEHVFEKLADGTLKHIEFPEFTDDEIRDAEVELYRERRVRVIPNRRAALVLLRERANHRAALKLLRELATNRR